MSRERGSPAARVVAQFCGLFISVLYRQHGFLSYGYARAPTLGKDLDDAAIVALTADPGVTRRPCGQYPVNTQDARARETGWLSNRRTAATLAS